MLVETQDKALRRISELREQCQLEQQAKAHLESAISENPDNVLNGLSSSTVTATREEQSLINLSSDGETSNEHVDRIQKLEKEIIDLKLQLESSQKEINEIRQREEEGNITVAQNKLIIHSELEKKESEVKKLRELITEFEANQIVTKS